VIDTKNHDMVFGWFLCFERVREDITWALKRQRGKGNNDGGKGKNSSYEGGEGKDFQGGGTKGGKGKDFQGGGKKGGKGKNFQGGGKKGLRGKGNKGGKFNKNGYNSHDPPSYEKRPKSIS